MTRPQKGIPFAEQSPEKQKQIIQLFRLMGWVDFVLITGALWYGFSTMLAGGFDVALLATPEGKPMLNLLFASALMGWSGKAVLDMLADNFAIKAKKQSGYSESEILKMQKDVTYKRLVPIAVCWVVGLGLLVATVMSNGEGTL